MLCQDMGAVPVIGVPTRLFKVTVLFLDYCGGLYVRRISVYRYY